MASEDCSEPFQSIQLKSSSNQQVKCILSEQEKCVMWRFYLIALVIAMSVSAIVIAASQRSSDLLLRSGGVPATQDDVLF